MIQASSREMNSINNLSIEVRTDTYSKVERRPTEISDLISTDLSSGDAFPEERLTRECYDGLPKSTPIRLRLSTREIEILRLVAFEYTTNSIANKLFISHHTVISHRQRMMRKLKVRNSAGLVRRAFELGILSVDRSLESELKQQKFDSIKSV